MEGLLNIVLRAMFLENLALVFLLGMCTYIAVSKRVETAIGLGIAVVGGINAMRKGQAYQRDRRNYESRRRRLMDDDR